MNSLPDRLSALDECGLRQTLVHGDYHPGNWRGTGNNLTILDWGDCFVGHPLLDIPGLTERSGTAELPVLTEHWLACWRRRLPDADIAAAHALIEPVATAKFAATYQMFLDNIETSEHIYHESDPALWFHNTAEILRREETP
jgi:aminoglycoside phosphotransferase (APT) family kinase protein